MSQFAQGYSYDRYGNRTINGSQTWGVGINNKQFTVNAVNNRLGVPSGQSGAMAYDAVGNLTTDTYSGAAVTRAYDGENRMVSETQGAGSVAGSYAYDGSGQRVNARSAAPRRGRFTALAESCWLSTRPTERLGVRRKNTAIATGNCW